MQPLLRVALGLGALAVLAPPARAQLHVTVELKAPALPDTAAVFVAGSLPALGNWAPDRIRLAPQGDHTWRVTITLDQPTSIEYKFTRGSWDREAADSLGTPGRNLNARITSDTVITTTVHHWTNGPRPRVLNGTVTGTLRHHRGVAGNGISERDIVVWLPPGYDASRRRRYPVLYMLDGQNIFDPATSSFGTDWGVDEAADTLVRSGRIPPLIIVGINSTAQRMTEYLPGPAGSAHMEYVLRTVKPLIDGTYRTRREARSTWIGGSSAGGIAAFMMVWEHADVFSRALAFSPAFQAPAGSTTRFDYVPNVRNAARAPRGVRFYLDIGGVGLEDQLRPGVDAMFAALTARGYRDGRDLLLVREPEAEHFEMAWRRRFPAALVWLLHQRVTPRAE